MRFPVVLITAFVLPAAGQASLGPEVTLNSVTGRDTVRLAWVVPEASEDAGQVCLLPAGSEPRAAPAPDRVMACALPRP